MLTQPQWTERSVRKWLIHVTFEKWPHCFVWWGDDLLLENPWNVMLCYAFHFKLICCSMRNKTYTANMCKRTHVYTHIDNTHTVQCGRESFGFVGILRFIKSSWLWVYVCWVVEYRVKYKPNHNIIIPFHLFHSSVSVLVILYVAASVFHL